MASNSFSLTGDKELIRKLEQLEKKDLRKATIKGCRAGNKIVASEAKTTVPQDTGRLKKSIKVRALPRSRKWIGSKVRADVPYAGPIEFGTKNMDGSEAMKQAAENAGQRALDTGMQIIATEIENKLRIK